MKYTEVRSKQMAFTQSPSSSNNPKILTKCLIFTERQSDKIETQVRNTSSGPTNGSNMLPIFGARTIWHPNIKTLQFSTKRTDGLFGTIETIWHGKFGTNKEHQNNILDNIIYFLFSPKGTK